MKYVGSMAKWTCLLEILLSVFGAAYSCGNTLDADVLILGAGMSGVAAARTLFEAGVKNFLVLEARDEIGGRHEVPKFAGCHSGTWCKLDTWMPPKL